MKRRNIFIAFLLGLCLMLVGCTPKEETKQPEQPVQSEQTGQVEQSGQKEESGAIIETEAEEILNKMNIAMAEKDDWLLKTELLGNLQTAEVNKELQLYDKCRILWMNDTVVLQGEGNLSLTASSLDGSKQKFDDYAWQYYTEEKEEGMNLYYTSDFSGKREQEIVAYQGFKELQNQIIIDKGNLQALVMTVDDAQLKDSCHHIDLTFAPYTVPMLQGQLKQAGIVLSEKEWQEAPAVTMTLAISANDYTLQRVRIDCTPIFEQWLTNEQIVYVVSGQTETPRMMLSMDVYYDREIH